MNQKQEDKKEIDRKNTIPNILILIIAINDKTSPTKLIEPGILRLANINNTRKTRIIKSNIKMESKYLEYVLLINKPANKNNAIDEKLWDKQMKKLLNKPHELNDKHETNTKFKCNIDEKAIIFFISKYRKQEQAIIDKPKNVKEIRNEVINSNEIMKEDIINLDKP